MSNNGNKRSMRLCLIENFTRHVEHIGVAIKEKASQAKNGDRWMDGWKECLLILPSASERYLFSYGRYYVAHTYLPPPSTTLHLQFRLS
jgi:hypothetical protein